MDNMDMNPDCSIARSSLKSLTPVQLHAKLIKYYLKKEGFSSSPKDRNYKTDLDILKSNHKFLWDEDEKPLTWEQNLAKKYYDKLFKEYCICDLCLYKEGKIAMRWRTENELICGKGQFECGSKHCSISDDLISWEVNFNYQEHGENKNALVKLRLCPDCTQKLHYKYLKTEGKRSKHIKKSNKRIKVEELVKSEPQDSSVEIQTEEGESDELAVTKCEENSDIWKGANKIVEEKSRDEDFEDFLSQLLL